MRNFVSVKDVKDIQTLVRIALQYKVNPYVDRSLGKDKRMGLLFLNPSMRTRISTQIASANLGMESIVFNVGSEGWNLEFADGVAMNGSSVEHVRDAAPVLGRYFDVIGIRTFPSLKNREEDYSEQYIQQLIKYAGVPVVSLESATLHPLQSLADVITIVENMKARKRPKVVLTWAPHIKALPQCVPNSFAEWINAWGAVDFTITHPAGYELSEQFTRGATIEHDQNKALSDADFVYVKNWSPFNDYGKISSENPDWMLNNKKMSLTNQAQVMHCLPVRRNVELSDEVLDGQQSLVTEQAANRVWAAQAVISEILKSI